MPTNIVSATPARSRQTAPRLSSAIGAWALGLTLITGLNSENDIGKSHFAMTRGNDAD